MCIRDRLATPSTFSLMSQGNSHANPHDDDNFLGTGAIRAGIPDLRQLLSNNKAALVVLNVARQNMFTDSR